MLALNTATPVSYEQRKAAILEATQDGLDVFAHFSQYFMCNGRVQLERNYPSPFPLDKRYRPSFRLYVSPKSGHVIYEDFAASRGGNCFDFTMHLLGLDFKQAFDYIEQTILHGVIPTVFPSQVTQQGRPRVVAPKRELVIQPWLREWDMPLDDTRYEQVGISAAVRKLYHCYALGGALISNSENREGALLAPYTITSTQAVPLYGYYYPLSERWKLNRPTHENKGKTWGPNNTKGASELFGQHLLPAMTGAPNKAVGLLGAGQRDTMALYSLLITAGYDVCCCCLSSESAHLTPEQFSLLQASADRWLCLTDNDAAGLKGAARLQTDWGIASLNEVVHALGSNDVCAWLGTDLGRQPQARLELGHVLGQHLMVSP